MLKTVDLIENVEEKYIPMLKKVNIPDFTKCIAVFSGLKLQQIDDRAIKRYLLTWAENKYRIFQLLGNELKKDTKIFYVKPLDDNDEEYEVLITEYPQYGPWFNLFKMFPTNKITYNNDYYATRDFRRYFPNERLDGTSITHFAKKYLKLPDDIVTKLGRIYENNKVKANYTLSIDPVDIMTASENPYNWTSCYRLETDNYDSHADGCMAAMLDENSIVSYVWTAEGKLNLYNQYELKNVRYKRMRQWIAISKNLANIAFCKVYPGKSYTQEFYKQLRNACEEMVANYLGAKNFWSIGKTHEAYRYNECYGYSEYDNEVYVLQGYEEQGIPVYTEPIICACGCGTELAGSFESDYEYLGQGFRCTGFDEPYYCDYCGDYCESRGEDCSDCCYWKEHHPVCGLDSYFECIHKTENHTMVGNVVQAYECDCKDCPYWKENCNEDNEDE